MNMNATLAQFKTEVEIGGKSYSVFAELTVVGQEQREWSGGEQAEFQIEVDFFSVNLAGTEITDKATRKLVEAELLEAIEEDRESIIKGSL